MVRVISATRRGLASWAFLASLAVSFAPGAAVAAGTTAAWGDNIYGRFGDGTTTSSSTPVAVLTTGALAGKTVTQVSAGVDHSCAVTSDGRAYCWGGNSDGQLGDGTTTNSNVPVAVLTTGALAGKTVIQISAGPIHSCAVTSDGGAYCWGANNDGALGDGSNVNRSAPVAVLTSGALAGKTVTQVSAGGSFVSYTCAATSDGRAYCWGRGPLGAGSTADSNVPVAVLTSGALAGKSVTQISVGSGTASSQGCVVTSDGGAYCWGYNFFGQLGDGTKTERSAPVAVLTSGVLAGKTVTQISAGDGSTCAATSDGRAYCWGSGYLGDGSTMDSSAPVAVLTTGALAGKAVTQVDVGGGQACALASDGGAYCWGFNRQGQLGNGSTSDSPTPVAVDTSGVLAGKFIWQAEAGYVHTAVAAPACGPGIEITSGPKALWHAFSLPQTATASPATVANVFGTGTPTNLNTAQYNVANAVAGTGWVVFRRDAATNANVRLAATDVLTPGAGYWIKSFQKTRTGKLFVDCTGATPPATVTLAQGCASANGCFALTLNNFGGSVSQPLRLAGNPFPWKIDWSKVRVRVTLPNFLRPAYTPAEAHSLGYMNKQFWVWNGASYDAYSDSGPTLGSLPYQGSFWVTLGANAQGRPVELLIPKDPTTLAQ